VAEEGLEGLQPLKLSEERGRAPPINSFVTSSTQ